VFAKRSANHTLLYSTMVLLASLTAASAAPGWGQAPGQLPQLPGKGQAGPLTEGQHSFADQAFVVTVLQRDATEVQLGQLAQQKSQSDDVKQLAQKILETRTKLDLQFKALAKVLAVSEPKGPTKKDMQLLARLEGLSGTQFDEEYVRVLVKNHRQDVKDFQVVAQSAENPSLQQALQMNTPILLQDLTVIERFAQAHNITIDAKK